VPSEPENIRRSISGRVKHPPLKIRNAGLSAHPSLEVILPENFDYLSHTVCRRELQVFIL